MTATTQKSETEAYFTELGNNWIIPGTRHLNSEEHIRALKAARQAGFGSLVVEVVAGQCRECLKMLEPLAPIA